MALKLILCVFMVLYTITVYAEKRPDRQPSKNWLDNKLTRQNNDLNKLTRQNNDVNKLTRQNNDVNKMTRQNIDTGDLYSAGDLYSTVGLYSTV